MTDQSNWIDNKKLMLALWPKWKPTPEQANLLNERWGQLQQDKLRECIRNNAMASTRVPNIAAIHREYCRVSGQDKTHDVGQAEVSRTRTALQDCQPIPAEEYADWERWAEGVLSTATPDELAAVPERLGINPNTRRVLAVAVNWCRENPER